MKLSELKNEQAIDAFADLLEPFAKIFSDKEVVKDIQADKPMLLILKKAMKNHKKAFIEIFAILDGEDPESYEFNILTIPKKLKELAENKEIADLFTSQGQTSEENVSGSATVITTENVI